MAIDAEHEYTHRDVPYHLGLILDGNRRWAVDNGLPKLEGHRRGYDSLKTISRAAFDRGIKYITAYVFSTENWSRTQEEVKYLMDLLYWVLTKELEAFVLEEVRLRWLGSREQLSDKMIEAIERAEEATKGYTQHTLGLCLNYGGQTEIVDAVRAIGDGEVTVESISEHLYAPEIPPIDLIIRTSGEQRLSNFMLWRAVYAEFYFAPMPWPAFTVADLDKALADYAERERRIGK